LKCAVSLLLLKAPNANKTLVLAEDEVWNGRRKKVGFAATLGRKVGSLANDIVI
jgi:hypothetical protein